MLAKPKYCANRRRKSVKTVASLALILALGSPAVAAAQGASTGSGSPTKVETKKPTTRTVSGSVKSSSQDTVVVAGRDKGKDAEWTFAVEPTTNIRRGGKSIVASDLRPGDGVQVRFREQGGKATAQSIVVKSKAGPVAKKTKP
jgi:hypothetical protein